jgi:hypothetical protein
VSPADAIRAAEIALAAAAPIMREVYEALAEGLDEQAAIRRAFARLAAAPDLTPTLPAVQAMIADARRPRSERGE